MDVSQQQTENKVVYYTYTLDERTNNVQKVIIQFDKNYLENLFNEEVSKFKNVPIRGFRPGKVPDYILRRMFYNDIIKSKVMEKLPEISNEIIKKEGLKPISENFIISKDVDNIIENDYKIFIEVPLLPDFSSINFEDITITKHVNTVKDEDVEWFINKEKITNFIPKQTKKEKCEKDDVVEISFSLYEIEREQDSNKPTIAKESSYLILNEVFLKNFSQIELKGYTITAEDIIGLEKGSVKKINVIKTEDNLIKKAYMDLWVKNIYEIDEERTMKVILVKWGAPDKETLYKSLKSFYSELVERKTKVKMFRDVVDIIREKHIIDMNYPEHIEKVLVDMYKDDFIENAKLFDIPLNVIEKELENFSLTDEDYILYKLEMLLSTYFIDKTLQPTDDEMLKIYCFNKRILPSPSIKEIILQDTKIVKDLTNQFQIYKAIEKILSKVKIQEEKERSIIIQ